MGVKNINAKCNADMLLYMYFVLTCTYDSKYQPERNPAISDGGIMYRLRKARKEEVEQYRQR